MASKPRKKSKSVKKVEKKLKKNDNRKIKRKKESIKQAKTKRKATKKAAPIKGKRGPKKKRGVARRELDPFTGLKKWHFSRIKQEYFDVDYINSLSDEEKAWLSSFMEEDLGARFNHKGKKIYKDVEDKRASYRRNNYRNFDMYSRAKAMGNVIDILPEQYEDFADESFEDRLINAIDDQRTSEEFPSDIKRKE